MLLLCCCNVGVDYGEVVVVVVDSDDVVKVDVGAVVVIVILAGRLG